MSKWIQRNAQPLPSQYHVDTFLTSSSVLVMNQDENFISARAAPRVPVTKQSGKIPVYTSADFRRSDMKPRQGATEAEVGGYGASSVSYYVPQFSLKKLTDAGEKANTDDPFEWRQDAAAYLAGQAKLKMEKEFAADCMTTSVWGTDSTPSNLWDNYTTSTPISDIEGGCDTILKATGVSPNKMVVDYDVWRHLKHHPDIVDRVNGAGTSAAPGTVTRQAFAEIFELDEILVMKTSEVTSVENETVTNAYLAPKDALLLYSPETATRRTPCAVKRLAWTGLTQMQTEFGIREYEAEELNMATVHEADLAVKFAVTASALGYFFSDAIS